MSNWGHEPKKVRIHWSKLGLRQDKSSEVEVRVLYSYWDVQAHHDVSYISKQRSFLKLSQPCTSSRLNLTPTPVLRVRELVVWLCPYVRPGMGGMWIRSVVSPGLFSQLMHTVRCNGATRAVRGAVRVVTNAYHLLHLLGYYSLHDGHYWSPREPEASREMQHTTQRCSIRWKSGRI